MLLLSESLGVRQYTVTVAVYWRTCTRRGNDWGQGKLYTVQDVYSIMDAGMASVPRVDHFLSAEREECRWPRQRLTG